MPAHPRQPAPATPAKACASRGMLVAFLLSMTLAAGFAPGVAGASGRHPATVLLQQADEAVREARHRGALWTTAEAALSAAHSAYAQEDFAQASRQARIAIEQARLGIAQLTYPRLRF